MPLNAKAATSVRTDATRREPLRPPPSWKPVQLPASRDIRLPKFYTVSTHALVKGKRVHQIYIYLQDTRSENMTAFYDYVSSDKFILPDGTEAGIENAGYLRLAPGDFIIARDMWGDGDEMNDVVQAFIAPSDVLDEADIRALQDVRGRILGDRNDRSPEKARYVDGEWTGGIAWERSEFAQSIGKSERCYTLAQSYQRQRNLVSPTAGAKVVDPSKLTVHHDMRSDAIGAAAPIAIKALEYGPDVMPLALKQQSEATNLPRIGFDGNYAFPTMQLNISSTKSPEALERHEFDQELGQFAGKHIDGGDSSGGMTCMISMGDLEESDEPGYFMLAELGAAIALRDLVLVCFCGLRYHGGFPPTARKQPAPWSYRFVIVCYPPKSMLDSTASLGFGALTDDELFCLPFEMTNPWYDNVSPVTSDANWLMDGPTLTTNEEFLRFFYRSFVLMGYSFGRQVNPKVGLKMDLSHLRKCFYLEDGGERIYPDHWILQPGSDAYDPAVQCRRRDVFPNWNAQKQSCGRFISRIAHLERAYPEHQQTERNRPREGRRDQKRRGKQRAKETPPPEELDVQAVALCLQPPPETRQRKAPPKRKTVRKRRRGGQATIGQQKVSQANQEAGATSWVTRHEQEVSESETSEYHEPSPSHQDDLTPQRADREDAVGETTTSQEGPLRRSLRLAPKAAALLPGEESNEESEESESDDRNPEDDPMDKLSEDGGDDADEDDERDDLSEAGGSDPDDECESEESEPPVKRRRTARGGEGVDIAVAPTANGSVIARDPPRRRSSRVAGQLTGSTGNSQTHSRPLTQGGRRMGSRSTAMRVRSGREGCKRSQNLPDHALERGGRWTASNEAMSQADSGLSEDEDAVMQDIGVGGDEEFGGSNEGIESGDVSSLNQTMGMVSTPAAAAPRYQNFLDLFQMDKLRLEQRSFANIARHMESSSEQRKTLLALGDYAQGFLGDRHSVEFASLLSRMWPAHTARVERIDVTDFRLSMERRQLMLYGATAWSWLTRDCVARIQDITEALDENAEAYAGCSDWLVALVRDVYAKVRRGGPAIYQASRYLPNVENTSRTVTISTSIAQQKNAASHTNNSVIRLLRDWLCFPNNTSLLAAYVVIHILNAFQNVDVLLFRGVWGAYKTIKGSILGTNQRSSSLQLEMLDPFVRALQRLPLSAPQTEERRMMDEISATVNNCLPGFRSLVDPLAQQLIKSSPLRKGGSSSMSVSDTSVVASLSRSNTITEQVSATEEESLAHIRGLSAPMPQSSGADSDSPGVQLLLDFMAELLPVINPHADITQFTRLQSLVNTNQDFFLPFREQAPSRLRLTSSEGPFHAHHIDSSGAFASWVISRALMFNSEVLLNHTHGYFPDLSAWHALLTAERFDPNKTESLDRFFNVKCYGTPQPKRRKGNNYVPQYFLQGNEWKQFEVRHRPAPIPFLTCVQWLLDQPLEMVGDLTAYLLAADLSYTGKVMRPTPREVGRAIWTMQGGSLAGLVALGLVASENAPVQEVTAAFGTLYGRLDARLQGEDKVKMGWDPIMAEHLLCKFTRIRRREGWRPPKRQGRKTRRSWK